MKLSQGQEYLAIPGPSVAPDAVLQAMHRAAPNIYEGELHEMTAGLFPDLKMVAGTDANVAIYIGNGHAAWEAALANITNPGDLFLVPATGTFALGWAEVAEKLGAECQIIDFGVQSAFELERIAEVLAADTSHRIKGILGVHVDTSSSVRSDIAGLRGVLDEAGHPALLLADCIASLGCDRFEMDAWGVDVMVAGSQKGLMTPPGVAFVYFSDKAAGVREATTRVSHYWDWKPRVAPEVYYQYFCGTAPTHHLYGLRVALDMIKSEGLEAVWARHEVLARAIWAAVETWGQGGPITLNVPDANQRSHAVTSLRITPPLGTALRRWCQDQAGLTLGIGLGMGTAEDPKADGFFRFGHMGHVNAQMILGMLATVQTGMKAVGVAYDPAGLDAAAEVIAKATT